jgi:hypothetical protein
MTIPAINYWAVLVAAIAAWILGAAYYMALARPWMAAHGWRSEADVLGPSGKPSPLPFAVAFVAELIMAWVLAAVLWHLSGGRLSLANGIIGGFLLWLGFVATAISVNYAFSKRPLLLIVIDAGHWLAALLVMGIIIGAWGV